MRHRGGDAGFTVIETLVALAIFVACYLLVHQSVSLGWRGAQVARTEAEALRLAQARLSAAGVDTALVESEQSGRTVAGYSWTTRIRPHRAPGSDGARSRLVGYWVSVEVTWQQGAVRRARSIRLATLKLGPRS